MQIRTIPVGLLEVNCYLAWADGASDAYLVDPGCDIPRIGTVVKSAHLEIVAILLTHAHVDHITGVGQASREFRAPVFLHPAEDPLYRHPLNTLPPYFPPVVDLPDTVAEPPPASWGVPTVIETPGHSAGGVCLHFPEAAVLFSGDTLFRRGVGRTDLPGGDPELLGRSIREHLYRLPGETVVYPGHGPPTTIGEEQRENPYVIL